MATSATHDGGQPTEDDGRELVVETSDGVRVYDHRFLAAALLIFVSRGSGRIEPEESAQMIELIQRIASVCIQNNIKACLHCGTADYAAKAIGWGYSLTTVSGDSRLLAGAAAKSVSRFRELTQAAKPSEISAGGY